ncbi:MAG TPA: acyltransferase [Flavobacteriales bacterium]|nr:acyltransferase [Flavobacteriales bacterium]
MGKQKLHFESLDALRFFAFLKVYLLHLPLHGDFPIFRYLKSGGGIGVAFFFVLSGFLITYLLVHDKIAYGQISLKNFFMRRSFRIWPLFYLFVILAFALPWDLKTDIGFHMVGKGYEPDWRFSFTFTENYNMLIHDNFPNTTPLGVFWSLCIEEHFYIVWMLAVFILPVRYIFGFLVSCFVVAWASRLAEPFIWHNKDIMHTTVFTNMDLFAAGGIVGYFVARHYEKFSARLNAIPTKIKWGYVLFVLLVVVFQRHVLPSTFEYRFDVIRPTIVALLFAGVVAVFVPKNSTVRIKSKVLNYLGSISYGLYVYHIVLLHMIFRFYLDHGLMLSDWPTVGFFILLTFGGSVLLSALSYTYVEKPFLKLREKISGKLVR